MEIRLHNARRMWDPKDSMYMLANLDLAAEIQRREWICHVAIAATQQGKSAGGITRASLLMEVLATEARPCDTLGHLFGDIRKNQESSNNHHRLQLRTELKKVFEF